TEADPTNAPSWQAWAIMERDNGDVEEARRLFKKGTEANPTYAPVWQAWAILEKKQKNYPQAIQVYLNAAKYADNLKSRARIYFELVTIFGNIGNYEEKNKYLLLSIEANPKDHIAQAMLGRNYGFQGN
ncbi:MAG: tetratricopeptide repeat protein, partial [Proteobacteria bacterium]|nr:tetratricopeptide repeat protein [Pseudomonadota bacterium]